ncbi:MAG: hypothetical protein ACYS6K_21140, partial [Planctomycetota bacterium]
MSHLDFNIVSAFEFMDNMSIKNPTLSTAADLAHFRHFIRRGGFRHFRHSFNYNIFPDKQIMQNEPNFHHFSSKNAYFTQKRSQFEPNSKPNEPNFGPISRVAKPNEPKTNPIRSELVEP